MSVADDLDVLIHPGAVWTEDDAGAMFAHRYDGQLTFCATERVWREFNGSVWERCDLPTGFIYLREHLRKIAVGAKNGGALKKLKYLRAVLEYVANDPRIVRSSAHWNRDPWLLGTPIGTVDLRTGVRRGAVPADHITRSTAISPAAWANCPLWRKFMSEATGGDEDLQRFLQQIAGYALTGSTREQSLFFIYGAGGNGKGVFINTVAAIMGDYATTAAMNTFTASRSERHTTDLAMLYGARLVTASETNQGQRWDQQRIAALTGEDRITARFMRQDNFTYTPQFTLVIIGNHKPSLSAVGDAMRRRFNIIPFDKRPTEPDKDLFERLKPEWPGILKWMIEGCLDWQADGMQRAVSVVERTNQYFADEDTLGQWLEDECEVDRENTYLTETSGALFRSWVAFAKRNEEYAGTSKTFKEMMVNAGFAYKRNNKNTFVHGVRLIPKAEPFGDT